MCTPTLLNPTHTTIQRTAQRREATIIINNGGGGARTCGEEAVRFTHTEATTSGAKAESEGILMKRILMAMGAHYPLTQRVFTY
jgi:hypothetical protein